MRVMPCVNNLLYHNVVIKTASGIVYLKVQLARRYWVGTRVLLKRLYFITTTTNLLFDMPQARMEISGLKNKFTLFNLLTATN